MISKLKFPEVSKYNPMFLQTVDLYGIQVINVEPDKITYEAIVFEDFPKEYSYCDLYVKNDWMGCFPVMLLNLEKFSDTGIRFILRNEFSPDMYDFILYIVW